MSRVQPAILLLFPLLFGVIVSAMPRPVYGAPVPKPERKITVEQLRALLGKSHLSKEIQVFRKSIGEKPVASYSVSGAETDTVDIDTCFFHAFHKCGLEMRFDDRGDLAYMHLYIQAGDGFKAYTGQLPGGLDPSDKPADVKRKLGDPPGIEDP